MLWLMKNPVGSHSIAYADNRVSLYAAQYGKCAVTGKELTPHEIHCHHKVPLHKGGTDDYANLVIVSVTVHALIHATQTVTIEKYLAELQLTKTQLTNLNKLRKLAENSAV
jgi:hypothetical protein